MKKAKSPITGRLRYKFDTEVANLLRRAYFFFFAGAFLATFFAGAFFATFFTAFLATFFTTFLTTFFTTFFAGAFFATFFFAGMCVW